MLGVSNLSRPSSDMTLAVLRLFSCIKSIPIPVVDFLGPLVSLSSKFHAFSVEKESSSLSFDLAARAVTWSIFRVAPSLIHYMIAMPNLTTHVLRPFNWLLLGSSWLIVGMSSAQGNLLEILINSGLCVSRKEVMNVYSKHLMLCFWTLRKWTYVANSPGLIRVILFILMKLFIQFSLSLPHPLAFWRRTRPSTCEGYQQVRDFIIVLVTGTSIPPRDPPTFLQFSCLAWSCFSTVLNFEYIHNLRYFRDKHSRMGLGHYRELAFTRIVGN